MLNRADHILSPTGPSSAGCPKSLTEITCLDIASACVIRKMEGLQGGEKNVIALGGGLWLKFLFLPKIP